MAEQERPAADMLPVAEYTVGAVDRETIDYLSMYLTDHPVIAVTGMLLSEFFVVRPDVLRLLAMKAGLRVQDAPYPHVGREETDDV